MNMNLRELKLKQLELQLYFRTIALFGILVECQMIVLMRTQLVMN